DTRGWEKRRDLIPIAVRVANLQLARELLYGHASRVQPHPRPQPGDQAQPARVATEWGLGLERPQGSLHRHWHVELDVFEGVGTAEAFGRDAHDGVGLPVHADFAADDSLVGCETSSPEVMADDQHRMSALEPIVLRRQEASQAGPDAKDAEEIACGDHTP